ncbi:MAG: phosphate ABC transporter substrate-binding protein PstS [Terracidiphilus sp.]
MICGKTRIADARAAAKNPHVQLGGLTSERATQFLRTVNAMNSNHRVLVTASAVLAMGVIILAAGCGHYGEEGKPEEYKAAGTNTRWVAGSGSTFIDPLMDRWGSDYEKSHPVHINYRPIGSGAGIDDLRNGYGSFAASDAPLSDEQLRGLPPIVQVPVTAGPVCVVYNLPGLKAPLRLSGRTLAGIYASEIISWQDPAIAGENPGAALPHMGIVVVHRSDGSGTTNILTSYLSKVNPAWATKYGQGLAVKWPAGIGESGSNAVLNTVKATPGTIGYLELSYAKKGGLSVASIQNRAGEYVEPSPESASLALNASIDALAKDLRAPIVDPPATAKGAYPITGMSFILIPKESTGSNGDQAILKDYLTYGLTTGQDVAVELSYVRLPPPVQQQGRELLSHLTQNGQPLN